MRSIFLLIFFFFTSCTSTHITGQYIDDSEFSTLNSEGKDKQSVMKILGSPTFAPENDPNTWYYISRTMKTGPLSKPKLTEQKIIKLSNVGNFDEPAYSKCIIPSLKVKCSPTVPAYMQLMNCS